DLGRNPGDALALLACGIFVTAALSREVGQGGCDVGKDFLGGTKLCIGLRDFGIDTAAAASAFPRLSPDSFLFRGKPRDRLFGVDGEVLFTLTIRSKLYKAEVKLLD